MGQHIFTTLVRTMRIPFLILTPVSVFLGYALSIIAVQTVDNFDVIAVFAAAMLAHISANMLNEYYDFRSGLDAKTNKTPFSGGSGALVDHPQAANTVLLAARASIVITSTIGLYFIYKVGLVVLGLGIVGLLIIVTYTQWLNRNPILCLLAPGIGFGPIMVVATFVVLTGKFSVAALFISLVPFFLVNNLLLLNQYPDVAADKSVGRRNFPIVYGFSSSNYVYGFFVLATSGILLLGFFAELLPKLSIISIIPMVLAVVVFLGIRKHVATSQQKILSYLGMNVAVTVSTSLLLGISILYG